MDLIIHSSVTRIQQFVQLVLLQSLSLGAFNFFENVIGLCGPDKRFGLAIMFLDISENAFLESFDAGKDAAPELILGEVAEESFDHVEPTAAGGREVEMKALVACRPEQNRRVFVGGIRWSCLSAGVWRSMRHRNFSHS